MELKDVKHGMLVFGCGNDVGMVTGLCRNAILEVLLKVQFSMEDEPVSIHPANVEPYEGQEYV